MKQWQSGGPLILTKVWKFPSRPRRFLSCPAYNPFPFPANQQTMHDSPCRLFLTPTCTSSDNRRSRNMSPSCLDAIRKLFGWTPNILPQRHDHLAQKAAIPSKLESSRLSALDEILKLLYFEWAPPWHFKAATFDFMSAWLIGSGEGRHTAHLLKCALSVTLHFADWLEAIFWHSFWHIFWHSF